MYACFFNALIMANKNNDLAGGSYDESHTRWKQMLNKNMR